VSAGANIAAVHMGELRLLLWAEWWVATLGRGRWWLVLGAEIRKRFWRVALEFYYCDRATRPEKLLKKLCGLAIHGRSEYRIGKKVIGRGSAIWSPFGAAGRAFGSSRRQLALVNQPSGHGGRGIFLEPLVHQRADLLAKVGGMAEAREFVALQAVTRSSQQKLPRGLGAVAGHEGLLWGQGGQWADSITVVHRVKNYCRVLACGKLWKTRGGVRGAEFTATAGKRQRRRGASIAGGTEPLPRVPTSQAAACSACAGDYEYPERTALPEEFLDEEYDGENEVATIAGISGADGGTAEEGTDAQ
jgi:hypothetical protein